MSEGRGPGPSPPEVSPRTSARSPRRSMSRAQKSRKLSDPRSWGVGPEASTKNSFPWARARIRSPSVLTISGSSTPAVWTFVVEYVALHVDQERFAVREGLKPSRDERRTHAERRPARDTRGHHQGHNNECTQPSPQGPTSVSSYSPSTVRQVQKVPEETSVGRVERGLEATALSISAALPNSRLALRRNRGFPEGRP